MNMKIMIIMINADDAADDWNEDDEE